jgi:methyltransferase (TIGR00027 family)
MRRPEGERICHDPLARYFLSSFYRTLGRLPSLARAYRWLRERRCPGLRGGILARTRFIDERLAACLGEGLTQLVILGAGYDSRAYRTEGVRAGVRVFEVDHPATQQVKIARLRALFGSLPDHVTFVPVDFCTDDLAGRLLEEGYDRRRKTLFVWEGVTYYIPAAAVDDTLSFVASSSGPGSSIVFDCFPRAVADGTSTLKEARGMHRFLRRHGEPLLFGLDPEEIEPFLRARGFGRVEIMSPTACKEAWFHGVNADMHVSEMFRFVHAYREGGDHGEED